MAGDMEVVRDRNVVLLSSDGALIRSVLKEMGYFYGCCRECQSGVSYPHKLTCRTGAAISILSRA